MKKWKFDNIDFIEEDIYEFKYPTFKIVFNGNKFYAESLEYEEEIDIIIIEDNESFKLEKDLELFNNYILTLDEFNKIKNRIKDS